MNGSEIKRKGREVYIKILRGQKAPLPLSGRGAQFVDKRGSELKNSEPLLKFPLNFRLKFRDWGSTSPLC
ncbi:hypothetical protein CQ056_07025 [Peribacillus simplex]|nr:hypothetical protein CQ056_07025 [Peribacillus simplex]